MQVEDFLFEFAQGFDVLVLALVELGEGLAEVLFLQGELLLLLRGRD